MKRLKFILPVALLLLLLLFLFTRPPKNDPNAPRYVLAQSPPNGPFGGEHYDWDTLVPFRDGKVWIYTALSRTNHHAFLYDLDNRKVLGELLNGGVALANQGQTKLLCGGSASTVTSFKDRLIALLNKASFLKIHIPTNRIDCFWFLDLKDNSAHRAGQLSEAPGMGSTWRPSPGFRYGYNVPNNNSDEDKNFFLCNLDEESFTKISFPGKLQGWWDEQTILIKDASGNLILFDIVTRKSSVLFSSDTIKHRLAELQITNNPVDLAARFNWNGHDYDVYIADRKSTWAEFTNSSFLLKVERSGPSLRLVSQNFKFKWLGHLSATGDQYLYAGESGTPGQGGNGAVYLRDVASNTERTLVPPDNSGQYSLPRFYRDSVIYTHNRVLWQVDLNGSNATRLFLPETQK